MKPLRGRIKRLESTRPAPVRDPAFAALINGFSVSELEQLLAELYRQIPEELTDEVLAAHPYDRDEIMRARAEPSNPALVEILSSARSSSDA
jgi:hypothetical protein